MSDKITCKTYLKSLESLTDLKNACRKCKDYCNKVYYKDVHGLKHRGL